MLSFCSRLALGSVAAAIIALPPHFARAQAAPGATYTSLYSFGSSSTDCEQPYDALIQGTDGNFYGTTIYGGANNVGTVFKITPSGTKSTIYSFGATSTDGYEPVGGLVEGPDGNFYGTTYYGGANPGANGDGTVFKVTPSGIETTLYTFDTNVNDGVNPYAGLVLGTDGNFYGTTELDGTYGYGGVFKITPSGTETPLYSFGSVNSDGEYPYAGLVEGADGNFYGTTVYGGANPGPSNNGEGTVFKITPTGAETTIYSFGGTSDDGMNPYAALIKGSDGNFYGTTNSGGANNNNGTVFKITPSGTETPLYSFGNSSQDGESPAFVALVQGSDGSFYGTTYYGGANGDGTVFELSSTGTETTLYSFGSNGSDGINPGAGLVQGTDGDLYGTTELGGANSQGTVFKIAAPGSGVRFDFNGDARSDLIWYNTASGDVSTWFMDDQTVLAFNGSFASVAPSSGWQPVASADVNNDGWPDLFWWNENTGEISIWTMHGTSVVQYGSDFATIADTDWKPEAIADVSGNAYSVVFQNSATGDISRWTMQGQTVLGYGGTLASLGANSPWQIVGAPDLDGDGKSDLLFWNSATGEVSYWGTDLTNSQVLSFNGDIAQEADTSWHLVGSEDTDGDGHSDLVWWNASTGEVSRWLMSGTTVTSYGGDTAQEGDTTWQPTAIR